MTIPWTIKRVVLEEKHSHINVVLPILITLSLRDVYKRQSQYIKDYSQTSDIVKIGYFSGSISHNENFELIKPAIKQLLTKYSNVQLHIVGILDIPQDMKPFENQIVTHDYVDWDKLPALISEVDINLAPLVDSIFNRAKSEIKWIDCLLYTSNSKK